MSPAAPASTGPLEPLVPSNRTLPRYLRTCRYRWQRPGLAAPAPTHTHTYISYTHTHTPRTCGTGRTRRDGAVSCMRRPAAVEVEVVVVVARRGAVHPGSSIECSCGFLTLLARARDRKYCSPSAAPFASRPSTSRSSRVVAGSRVAVRPAYFPFVPLTGKRLLWTVGGGRRQRQRQQQAFARLNGGSPASRHSTATSVGNAIIVQPNDFPPLCIFVSLSLATKPR